MSKQQSPSRMLIMLPLLFVMNKVDFENPMILNSARVAYVFCQLASLLTYYYIKQKIEAKKDMRKIRIPGVQGPFNPEPNYQDVTETTYHAHELSKVNEFIKQLMIGAAISSFIHMKMGVNQVVLIQSVMTPLNLWDNVLVQAYIFGKRDGRIWNEKLEGEPLDAPATDADDKNADTKKQAKKKITSVTAITPEEAIAQALAAGADADFDELWDAVKKNVNATTKDDSWTALMVACGSPIDTDEFIRKIVKAGADVAKVDGDGWTALHWSAFHGRPEAAEALLESVSASQRAKLLAVKATDSKTALETAKDEGNDDVVEVIEKVAGAGKNTGKDATTESELRRRKAPESSVEDVD